MLALFVTLHVKPEHLDAFLASMLDDARGSVNHEPGCFRFDVHQDDKDPSTIYLYEVYLDRAAFDEHLKQPHFTRWRDTVKDWYSRPGQTIFFTPVFPADADWKK